MAVRSGCGAPAGAVRNFRLTAGGIRAVAGRVFLQPFPDGRAGVCAARHEHPFEWAMGSPDPALCRVTVSRSRWTGSLRPDVSNSMSLIAATDDGVQLWLDGKLLIGSWVRARGAARPKVTVSPWRAGRPMISRSVLQAPVVVRRLTAWQLRSRHGSRDQGRPPGGYARVRPQRCGRRGSRRESP